MPHGAHIFLRADVSASQRALPSREPQPAPWVGTRLPEPYPVEVLNLARTTASAMGGHRAPSGPYFIGKGGFWQAGLVMAGRWQPRASRPARRRFATRGLPSALDTRPPSDGAPGGSPRRPVDPETLPPHAVRPRRCRSVSSVPSKTDTGRRSPIGRNAHAAVTRQNVYSSCRKCTLGWAGSGWRKLSFETQSAGGSRFVETMLKVNETCGQQDRNVLSFLLAAVEAHLAHSTCPLIALRGVNCHVAGRLLNPGISTAARPGWPDPVAGARRPWLLGPFSV